MSRTVRDVAMMAAPSNRSRIYLDVLERRGLLPAFVILLDDPTTETAEQRRRRSEDSQYREGEDVPVLPEDPHLDTSRTVRERLEGNEIAYRTIDTLDPNDAAIVDAVSSIDHELVIYSGPGGAILDRDLLTTGSRFLHVHAGVLPEYRGSTTVYYSLLADGQCGATAFIMNEQIDQGPIVGQETYPPPQIPETLDLYYDPWIRSQLLVKVLSEYRDTGTLEERPQQPDEGETYYIVHPVLKHLALLSLEE